ncbi:MAG: hypothetical protein H0U79_08455 [Solirubrobacterales bacterium]|nr:hypothetical protein [Solirubrobacterales bacterium]
MDDKVMIFMGAAAGLTLAGRGLRPVAKLAIKGVVAAADATEGARRGLGDLYAEAKAEQRGAVTASEAASAL